MEVLMGETVRAVAYFKMSVPDKPGVAAEVLGRVRDAGIDLLAFSGFPRRRGAQLDFVVTDPRAFKAAVKGARLKIAGPKTCFVISGEDRPGAVADVLATLARENINVTAIDATCAGQGRYGAILWVKPRDVKKAAGVLAAV
jgi:prephenate dehydratase